jgi:glycosyltransferase involved in cell wall biosynthesis
MTVARWFRDGATSIVYDAHELFLFQPPRGRRLADFWTRTTRPIFLALERRLARQATAVVTVTEPLARWYAWKFRVPRPCVVRNALDPLLRDDTGPVDLRKIVEPTCAILVHTGIITNRGRSLSETVEALQYVPESVCLVFLGQGEHQEDLQETARKWGVSGRVFFVPPVLPDEVPETIRSADAALVLLRPDSVNTWGALPNKLFEAVAAGLPVVVSPTFALARVVVEHDLGPVCVGFGPQEIAAGIQAALSPEGQSRYRARVMAAQQKMNWQHEAAKLCQIYEGILR